MMQALGRTSMDRRKIRDPQVKAVVETVHKASLNVTDPSKEGILDCRSTASEKSVNGCGPGV